MMRTVRCATVALVAMAASILAQSPSWPPRGFETASIKINNSGQLRTDARVFPSGRVELTNRTLKVLIQTAYLIQDFQIAGGPDWLNQTRFDIAATAGGAVTQAELQLMLRGLLTDRFKLAVHTAPREMPIYALTRRTTDGSLGAQLRASDLDCVARRLAPPQQGPPPAQARPCGFDVAGGSVIARGFPLSRLADSLSTMLRRTVVDRTGLSGTFDFDLTWAPDQMPQQAQQLSPPGRSDLPPVDPGGPSIFTAIQEQLGLKLESTRGAVDVLVVDRAELPTED
jgi:uncharacterized protein (TIGR03435 family)